MLRTKTRLMTKLGDAAPGGGRYIPLTRGYMAIVDDEDFARVAPLSWQASIRKNGYILVKRGRTTDVGARTMGRFILGVTDRRIVDHVSRDTLDNRRLNLRVCNRSENGFNRKAHGSSSKFKGVCLDRSWSGRWYVQIRVGSAKTFLGRFESEEDAAHAYDKAARMLHGEFATVNFPTTPNERCALRKAAAQ